MTKKEARRLIKDFCCGIVQKNDPRLVTTREILGIPETVRIMNTLSRPAGIVLVDLRKVATHSAR